jgi:predicted Zn finger-like uncharacterized protein
MIIVCQNCSTRLQLSDDKTPSRSFTVRCPKCQQTINSGDPSPASEQSALTVGGSPATDHPRFEQSIAPAFQPSIDPAAGNEVSSNDEAIRLLISLLSKGSASGLDNSRVRSPRKVLICAGERYRESIARNLSENGYQVYAAEDTRQAVETMRANKMEVVLLEPQFDLAEQGMAFVVREINVLRPPQRRRVFFVLVSPSLRSMDAHAAFLSNVNVVVNVNDLGELPRILDVSLQEFNELYQEFNIAFNLQAL